MLYGPAFKHLLDTLAVGSELLIEHRTCLDAVMVVRNCEDLRSVWAPE